jgi:hypothetical protein
MKRPRHLLLFLLALFLLPISQGQQPPTQAPTQSKDQQQAQPPPKPAKLSGRILRADDRRPIPKATVTISPETTGGGLTTVSVRTNSGGVYEFPEVVPGRYRLRAERTGYVSEGYGQAGGGPGVAIVLQPSGHLKVSV